MDVRVLRGAAVSGMLALWACGNDGSSIRSGAGQGQAGGAGLGNGSSADPGGAAQGAAAQTRAQFCAATGAGIVLPGTNSCTGDLAKKTFRFAVCSCDSLSANGAIKTSSFDSNGKQALLSGGSLGTNGDLHANASAEIGGSAWAAGSFVLNGDGHVFEELHAGQGGEANGALTVDGDYYATLPLRAVGGATVKGASHVPAAVPAPCDCAEQIPIPSIVSAFQASNDDAASGLTPETFAATEGREVALDCGRYYFTEISTQGSTTLRLKGRTAIFVAGDIRPNGGLQLAFDPGAELDLFVTGDVSLNGDALFGDVDSPARVRVYAHGTTFSANGSARFAANVYAPNAVVGINGDGALRGAIYAKGLDQNGRIDVEYDEAVLSVKGCDAPAAGCQKNEDCGAPLICQNGACVASVK